MILVTGASGIVGSQIVRYLVGKNEHIKAIKRESSNISWLADIDKHIEWHEADILDIVSLERAFDNVTHVIHCAAVVSFDNSNDSLMHRVNVEGTRNILALSDKFRIKKLIHISSVAALGRSSQDSLISEDAKWVQSSLNTAYAISKYQAELEVWRAQEEGLSTVILNPSIVIGPGDWSSSSLNLFKHVRDGNPVYPGGSLNYVDVRDISYITHKLLSTNIEGQRYVLNGGMLSYKSFFELVAKVLNKKAPYIKLNTSLAIFVASILKVVRMFTGIKTLITKEAVILSQLNIGFSAQKIEKELNIKFRPIQESIQWTCDQLTGETNKP